MSWQYLPKGLYPVTNRSAFCSNCGKEPSKHKPKPLGCFVVEDYVYSSQGGAQGYRAGLCDDCLLELARAAKKKKKSKGLVPSPQGQFFVRTFDTYGGYYRPDGAYVAEDDEKAQKSDPYMYDDQIPF